MGTNYSDDDDGLTVISPRRDKNTWFSHTGSTVDVQHHSFDGVDDFLECAQTGAGEFTQDFSVAGNDASYFAYARPNSGNPENGTLFDSREFGGGNHGNGVVTAVKTSTLVCRWGFTGGAANGVNDGAIVLDDDEYHVISNSIFGLFSNECYVDGIHDGSFDISAINETTVATDHGIVIGDGDQYLSSSYREWQGPYAWLAFFNKAFSEAEQWSLSRNFWQIAEPERRVRFVPAAAAGQLLSIHGNLKGGANNIRGGMAA